MKYFYVNAGNFKVWLDELEAGSMVAPTVQIGMRFDGGFTFEGKVNNDEFSDKNSESLITTMIGAINADIDRQYMRLDDRQLDLLQEWLDEALETMFNKMGHEVRVATITL